LEDAWSSIPILTRAEAVANRERLFARTVPPEVGPTLDGITSGSTGYPFPYRRSNITLVAAQALNERMYRWWKVDGRKPFARIAFDRTKTAGPPDGTTLPGWHSAHPGVPHYFLSTAADIRTQMQWLAQRKPAYLASYSNLLKEIARASGRPGPKLKFELLFSFGTVVDEEARDLCRRRLGAEIADTYGADEVGHFASQCPHCNEYHVSAEATRVEVLRDDGSPAAPGEIGRVIVTSLYNYAQPLIRYEPGDLAEAGAEQARCRRGLRSLRRILGRYRNVFRFRDGTVRSPSPERFGVRDLIPMRQSQVIQLDFDRIEIRFVPDGRDFPIDLPALTERIRSVLGQRVDVNVCRVDRIDRSPSGKYEDCISLVPPAFQQA
jgi:phenylacetate-CoA ligase